MVIHVNEEQRAVAPTHTLLLLLQELGLAERKGVAVAINDEVVARSKWAERRFADADRVLLIQATQGG